MESRESQSSRSWKLGSRELEEVGELREVGVQEVESTRELKL